MSSLQDKVRKAKEVFDGVKALSAVRDSIYWKQAESLYTLKKDNLFRFVFGSDDQSWSSFLSEVQMPLSSADQKVRTWDFYIVRHGFTLEELSGVDTSSLYTIATNKPMATKEEITALIGDAKVLGRGDFLAQLKGVDCIHPDTVEESHHRCKVCKRKLSRDKEKHKPN